MQLLFLQSELHSPVILVKLGFRSFFLFLFLFVLDVIHGLRIRAFLGIPFGVVEFMSWKDVWGESFILVDEVFGTFCFIYINFVFSR